MKKILFVVTLAFFVQPITAQEISDKHKLIWSAGVFKSWLKDQHLDFNKIGNTVSPVFTEQYKMGLSASGNYVFKMD